MSFKTGSSKMPINKLTAEDIKKYFDNYVMTQKKRRVAYIFKDGPFQKEVENIRNALGVLGFNETDIKVHTFEEMCEVSKEFNIKDIDCILCVIMKSDETKPECADVAEVHDLLSYLKADRCSSLIGVPKLIFVEASRGSKIDINVDDQQKVNANEELVSKYRLEEDTLLYFSSCPDYSSFKNEDEGSWFFNILSKILIKYGTTYEMMILLTAVSKHVAAKKFESDKAPDFKECKQMPCIMSTLTKKLKFEPPANQM
uniref:Caspase family p20 domain-containing protein n=1 Tax=Octopus bimaculoides TaxID=37653 RepID=A0A0L8H7Z8_OCTBM|eukprot:XP_014774641.1 PREDICTED: caspase-6-like [Octopus bimaculoides]